jgi:SAM-dependent methyltransferase
MHLSLPYPIESARRIVWEECACLMCGCAVHLPLLEASDPLGGLRFLIVKCTRCGLAFTNPRPDPASIKQFYPADYRCHGRLRETHRVLPRCVARTLQPFGQARLLDFGCGTGGFLRRMKASGWQVTGLDMSAAAVARAHDLPVRVGTLPHPLWNEPSFEAITMWQSLEHVHQPLEVLQAANRLLTTGGKLLVAVPNFDSFASCWFGGNWFGLDVPRHLTHFTPESLRMMLGHAGFERVEIHQERRSSWIRHSAGSGFLKTRFGSGLAGWWGYATGRGDSLIAIGYKLDA